MKLEEAYNAAGRTETFILLESNVLDFDRKVKEVIRTEAEEGILLNEDVTIERLKNSSLRIEKLKTDLESLESRLRVIREGYFLLLEQMREGRKNRAAPCTDAGNSNDCTCKDADAGKCTEDSPAGRILSGCTSRGIKEMHLTNLEAGPDIEDLVELSSEMDEPSAVSVEIREGRAFVQFYGEFPSMTDMPVESLGDTTAQAIAAAAEKVFRDIDSGELTVDKYHRVIPAPFKADVNETAESTSKLRDTATAPVIKSHTLHEGKPVHPVKKRLIRKRNKK